VPEQYRLEGVKTNTWVDEAFLMDDPITEVLLRIQPGIVVKGKEHETRFNPELSALEQYGGKLLFSSGESTFSSLDLIRREFTEANLQSIRLPHDFLNRHNLTANKLSNRIQQFSGIKVCVIGDLIVDEYITCQPLGMSQEDPTIVVTPIDSTKFVGGAGIVAAHAAGMGAKVDFLTVVGTDDNQAFAEQSLSRNGVDSHFFVDEIRPTTLKQRFRAGGKTLLRVSHLHQDAISSELQEKLLERTTNILDYCHLVIFSDFNYGCLPQALVNSIIAVARSRNVMLAADSQSSSQVGDISRFQGMDLITPTEREARISARNCEDGLVVLAENLRTQANSRNILLKLGKEGLLIHADHTNGKAWLTDRVLALNPSPKDVAGAGDSLLIASALALASGASIWEAAVLGSLAAGIQVSRVGNTPIQKSEMLTEINQV
jgi:rfaE bifunctional protein kinase chain/domain